MKKKNIIIFNIGHRDLEFTEPVTIKNKEIEKFLPKNHDDNFRDNSKYVLDHYDEFAKVISFPFIEKTFRYLARRSEQKINTIYLFASDQEPPHDITDTIYIPQIFKKYLNDLRRHEDWSKILDVVEKPKIRVINKSPADLDVMNQYYDGFFSELKERDQVHKVYISTTGGTPAMNNMAWFNGIKYFQDDVECVYLPYQHRSPKMLNIGKKLVQETYIRSLKENLDVYEYYAAWYFLESVAEKFSNKSVFRSVLYLLKYCHQRLSFNFDEAVQSVSEIENENAVAPFSDRIYALKDDIYHISEENQTGNESIRDYMLELYWNTYILYSKGQYIDACGRLFRFQEQAFNYLITEIFGVRIKDQKYIDSSWISDQTELIKHLESIKTNGAPLDYKGELNRALMQHIAEFYIADGGEKYQKTLDTINAFDHLARIRNKSPMAHGFSGVSEIKMYKAIHPHWKLNDPSLLRTEIFQKMKSIYTALFGEDRRLEKNIYSEINSTMFELLKELN